MLDTSRQDALVAALSEPAMAMCRGAEEFHWAMLALNAPHVRMRPAVFKAPGSNKWCASYSPDSVRFVQAFGDSPAEACAAFDRTWDGAD